MPTGEVDTGSLVSEIQNAGELIHQCLLSYMLTDQSSGKTLYVPRIDRTLPSQMNLLQIYSREDLQNLPSGTWGIKEPNEEWKGGKRMDGKHSI